MERNDPESPTADENAPRRPGFALTVLALFAGLCALLAVGGTALYFLVLRPTQSLPDRVASAIAQITGAEVTVSTNTVHIEDADIAELAVVSRTSQTIVKYTSENLVSDSVLILRGDFEIKAGFDLSEPFSIDVDEATGIVDAHFPPAKILSVEMKKYEVYHSDEGFLNRLTPEKQQMVTARLLAQARVDAENSDILEEAEARLATRLQDLLGTMVSEVKVDGESFVLP